MRRAYLTMSLRLGMRLGMEVFSDFVAALMEFAGLDQVQFAKRVDVKQPTVSRWLTGSEPKEASKRRVESFARKIGFRDAAPRGGKVSVMGKIGAGAEIVPEHEQVPPEGLYQVEVVFPLPEGAMAFEVDGESMYPRFRHRDLVVCVQALEYPGRAFEAAVLTEDGRRFLKTVHRGSGEGLYDLESYNAPMMRNVKLSWMAVVCAVFPAGQWHHLSVR